MWYLMRLKLGHKVAANGTPSQLAIQQNQGPDSVIPAQIAEMPFEVGFGEVKENDGGDGIDHSQRPPIPSSTMMNFTLWMLTTEMRQYLVVNGASSLENQSSRLNEVKARNV